MRYLKQALALIREEKLYSAMYIAGTALAVAFVMLIAEVYYVKVADIAPEVRCSHGDSPPVRSTWIKLFSKK